MLNNNSVSAEKAAIRGASPGSLVTIEKTPAEMTAKMENARNKLKKKRAKVAAFRSSIGSQINTDGAKASVLEAITARGAKTPYTGNRPSM